VHGRDGPAAKTTCTVMSRSKWQLPNSWPIDLAFVVKNTPSLYTVDAMK
jgi:hypothetical protein